MEPVADFEALYGPVEASYRASRRTSRALGLGLCGSLGGAALLAEAVRRLGDAGPIRPLRLVGMAVVGSMLLALGPLALWGAWERRHNRIELRRDGLVRHHARQRALAAAQQIPTKHLRYTDIVRVERKTDGGKTYAVHLTSADDEFLAIADYELDLDEFARAMEERRTRG